MQTAGLDLGALVSNLDDLLDGLPDVLTVKEVADLLRMSTEGVRKWTQPTATRGRVLPAMLVEGKTLILRKDLRALLEKSYREGGTAQ